MVLFLTGTLYISILGMGSLVYTKRWENRTGRILFARVRPWMREHVHMTALFFMHILPRGAQRSVRVAGRYVRHVARHAAAASMLWLEQKLEQILHTIRHTAVHAEPTQFASSPFLREVAEYKKALMHRTSAQQIARMAEE